MSRTSDLFSGFARDRICKQKPLKKMKKKKGLETNVKVLGWLIEKTQLRHGNLDISNHMTFVVKVGASQLILEVEVT